MSKEALRLQSRYWCFTSFQDKDGFLWYAPENMVYLVQQEERCPTTGRVHWQGFVVFEQTQRLSALRKILHSAHWEKMRGSVDEAADYCCDPKKRMDGGLLLEDGVRPLFGDVARAVSTRARYETAYNLAKEGNFLAIEPSMMVRHLPNLLKIHNMFGKRPDNIDGLPVGIWIAGAAGTGKTTLCQSYKHYVKDPRHKWFDGYQSEDVIVVDDFAPFHVAQTDILKQLGHQFVMQGETKGGAIWLRPRVTIVTSQYMMHEIWPPDKDGESHAAVSRRYRFFEMAGGAEPIHAYISLLLAQPTVSHVSQAHEEESSSAQAESAAQA